jgi:hypothetical protein
LGSLAVCYLLLNGLLFGLGSHTLDMASQKIWAYIAAYYGPAELSFLAMTVTPAEVFGGVPYAPAGYPYGPAMSWLFTGLGWAYRMFVGPSGSTIHSHDLDYLIKTVNVSFTLLDGLFIYLILLKAGVRVRTSRIATGLFVLNPAVWFMTSVWGETQTVTVSLVLAAVWAAQHNRAAPAWSLIAVAVLSRPQMAVPGIVLGILLLRWFHLTTNLRAIASAIGVVALMIGPLFFVLGPSFPLDYLLFAFHSQTAPDSHAAQYNYVSFDAYNIWPLITGLVSGQIGKNRIYYPGSSPLLGGLAYNQVATLAVYGALALVAGWAFYRGRQARSNGTFTTILASSTLALLMLATGIAAQHFVIALAFVVMSINVIPSRYYFPLVTGLSLTTLVATYGSLGFAVASAPTLAPALWAETNSLTRFFMNLFTDDRFITGGVLANVVVLLAMTAASITGSRRTNSSTSMGADPSTAHVAQRLGDVRSRWLFWILAGISVLVIACIAYITRYLSFFYDEWDFVSWFRPSQPTSIWIPHNEHWSTLPILAWKVLFRVFGIRSHVPYEVATLAVHLACVLLLFQLVRRRSGDLPAFAAALTLLVFGSGGTNIVWAFQIAWVGSVAFGLLAMLLLDGNARLGWRMFAASAALVSSLMCSGIGLAFLVAVGLELAIDRQRRQRLVVLVLPIAAYGLWFVTNGAGVPGSPGLGADFRGGHLGLAYVANLANFVTLGAESTVAGIFGWAGIGTPLLPIVVALVAVHWYRQGKIDGWQVGMIAGAVAQFTLIGLVRSQNGLDAARDPHYVYIGAVFLLPVLADAARELPWRSAWRPALVAVFATSLISNSVQLRSAAVAQTQLMKTQTAELQTVELFRGAPDMSLYSPLDDQIMPQLVAARYFAATDELGSPVNQIDLDHLPALPTQAVERVMLNLFGAALSVRTSSEESSAGLPCRNVDSTTATTLDFQVPVGQPLMIQSAKEGDVSVYLSFFKQMPAEPLQHIQLKPATPAWIHVPDTGKPTVWQLRIKTSPMGLLRICGVPSLQLRQTVTYVYAGEAAGGQLGLGWSAVPDTSTSSARAARAAGGTVPVQNNRFATDTFGAAYTPDPGAYDVWYRVKVTSATGSAAEMMLGMWDDTGVGWLGSTTFRANQVGTSYRWIKVAAGIVPVRGHLIQFQAYAIATLGTDWYIDTAVMAPAGSPAPA